MSEPKDNWDKTEIIAKGALPLVIAIVTLWFNAQSNARQESVEKIKISLAVLSTAAPEGDVLRKWAIEQLVEHAQISRDAADALLQDGSKVINSVGQTQVLLSAAEARLWIENCIDAGKCTPQ